MTVSMVSADIRIKGSTRLVIRNPDGSIHGDSGWKRNQVVNLGYNDYICQLLGGMGGSKQLTHVALGTGTVPGAAATSLDGEAEVRQTGTFATSSTSKKLRCTATFNSALSFVTATMSLQNIAMANTSAGGTIMCGNTYATSTCATNQQVEVSYDVDLT